MPTHPQRLRTGLRAVADRHAPAIRVRVSWGPLPRCAAVIRRTRASLALVLVLVLVLAVLVLVLVLVYSV